MSKLKLFFGGSFDPIHNGHILSAQQLVEATQAADITLLPNALSPLKQQQHCSTEHRRQLLELALADYPELLLDWREVERGGRSYTCETLQELAAQYPQQHIGFVMGLDSFNQLDHWRDWQKLCDYAHLLVIARPGYQPALSQMLKAWLADKQSHQVADLHQLARGKVYFCQLQPMPISSTQLRKQLATHSLEPELSSQLPGAVLEYIIEHKLYGA
ncbi:nicotinate-nucleotide adenylyltransferase [Agarivorans sp.]|uniref:nicotinate-nucleotide adenylyltransferase n=1 Tax=Agarivorans sp. TaxID=1872412 RepID=UPI003D066FD8